MKKQIKFYYICLIFILYSCQEVTKMPPLEITNVEFKIEEKVDFSYLESDLLVSYPISMFITDSLIVIQDYQGIKSFFYVLDRTTGRLLSNFVHLGHGSDEVLNTSNNYILSEKCDTLTIYDDKSRRLFEYILLGNSFKYSKKESTTDKENRNNIWIKEYFKIDDKISFSTGYNGSFEKNRFLIFDQEKSIPTCDYPNMSLFLYKDDKLSDLFYGPSFFKINKNNKKAAFGTYKGGLLQIIDLSKLPKKISIDTTLLLCSPYEGELETRINRYGFEDIFVTNKYIYTLYNGKTTLENDYFANEILIFNWDGTSKIKLLSELSLRCLCVDEKKREILAVAYHPEKSFCLIKIVLKDEL